MPKRISDTFNLSSEDLIKKGVLDTFTDIDSLFHLDPYLLKNAQTPELSNSYEKLQIYFKKIIRILDASTKEEDRMWREATKLISVKEFAQLGLGYSKNGKDGNAIGYNLAKKIAQTAQEIINAGIKDPVIFELVGLFEKGIGADRISDLTAYIILTDLLNFTSRIAIDFNIPCSNRRIRGVNYSIPIDPTKRKPLIFVPCEIISPLPVAYSWEDIDYVCSYNQNLRDRVNGIIGDTWKDATNQRRISKADLKYTLLNNPEVLKDLIDLYKSKAPKRYDFEKDPIGEFSWFPIAKEYAEKFPIDLNKLLKSSTQDITCLVNLICEQYKNLIENNGLFKLFYDDNKKLRHERFAQFLFYGIADSYCEANDIDLSREPNAGRGAVDFKLSSGYNSRVTVEIKYSTNTHLINGFTKQLPIYDKAETAQYSIYLIIKTSDSNTAIDKILKLKHNAEIENARVPDVIIIDGKFKESASNS